MLLHSSTRSPPRSGATLRAPPSSAAEELLKRLQTRTRRLLLTELNLDSPNGATTDPKFWPDLLAALHYGRGRALRSVDLSLDLFAFVAPPESSTTSTTPEAAALEDDPALEDEQEGDAPDAEGTNNSAASAVLLPQQNSSWMLLLLQTLGRCCPRLTSLRLYASSSTSTACVPAHALAETVHTCRHLQTLAVTRSLHFTSHTQVQALADAVHGHPALQEMKLLDLKVTFNDNDSDLAATTLDPLMQALSTVLTLESVDLSLSTTTSSTLETSASTTRDTDAAFSPRSLASLLDGCPHLTDITLWGCGLHDAHLSQALTPSLQRHDNLQFLSLRRNDNISDAAWCRFYHSLEHCYCLQTLFNDHVDFSPHHHPALLRHASNGCDTAQAAAAAEIFMGLNALGRGMLLTQLERGANVDSSDNNDLAAKAKEEWVELLDSIGDSEAALYYMIRAGAPVWTTLVRNKSAERKSN